MITIDKTGALKAILSPHMESKELTEELDRYPKQTIIGLGQGGGRIAAELSRFGFPTYLVNSSKSDMEEHSNLIPENRRILTKSTAYPELEGTDKNAVLGLEIAKENATKYKELAINDDVTDADFVWVTVSLGGGTGNGALKLALSYLSQIREKVKRLPDGKIPLGVICSLPSKDEKGSVYRKNALTGIAVLQKLMDAGKIGSALVIDNEKMKDYYAKQPLKTYGGTEIDAKSYSNMVVAALLAEVASIPLLKGRAVYDKTEFLSTISTPGWLSVSKLIASADDNVEQMVHDLFNRNEVLATYEIEDVASGGVAVMYPASKKISPKTADDIFRYTSEILQTKVNLSITTNKEINGITIYGLAVMRTPSSRVIELKNELVEWQEKEEEEERRKQQKADALGLSEFVDIFSSESSEFSTRKPIERESSKLSLDDLDDEWDKKTDEVKKLSINDLKDIDF
ncbi:cell division protein FtsZ [Pseudobacillus sp. 179-B 2D1 NHS]|uniref:cell division protein FtsZ n=1 Tax=Pseudobacillus sp. 179-B 2D1 NHS TaxID=3374292 RepID=UPI00387A7D4D